ncbi:unnamed protein product [Blepharisma stoltei]|uniref:Cation-transporting P-type ATPase C-terminal domain-containing protein n=1 Tax=Blepharisma stoltei TaxID=1481888 RepID=A0AAU9JU36_9CILI|nr:unnamed protein product [Blepharisma stoltei]
MIAGTENFDIDDYQSLVHKEQSGIFKRLQKFLLVHFIEIFEPELNAQISYRKQITLEMISTIIITIQVISLFWYPGMPLRHWSSYSMFWDFLSYFSICIDLQSMAFLKKTLKRIYKG